MATDTQPRDAVPKNRKSGGSAGDDSTIDRERITDLVRTLQERQARPGAETIREIAYEYPTPTRSSVGSASPSARASNIVMTEISSSCGPRKSNV